MADKDRTEIVIGITRDEILGKLSADNDLPSLPDIVTKLEQMRSDPDVGLVDVAKLVETEAVLSGKIIKLSNSVYFGGEEEIKTVHMAVVRLGLERIRNMTYSLTLTKLFVDVEVLDSYKFWMHNLAVALFSRLLAKQIKLSLDGQELCYLAGLMHDIGVMSFEYLIPEEYTQILKGAASGSSSLDSMEMEYLSIDHAELGARFIEQLWNIEPKVVEAVRDHHAVLDENTELEIIPKIINVANRLCNKYGFTHGIVNISGTMHDHEIEALDLTNEDALEVLKEVRVSVREAEMILKA